MEETKKLGTMNIKKLILVMSLPAMVSMITQALYNTVDSIFVANLSEDALTSLTLAFPIQLVIISLFAALGIGLNVFMSHKIGEGNIDDAKEAVKQAIILGIIIWFIIAISSFFLPGIFMRMFTDNKTIIDGGVIYLQIVMFFSLATILSELCMNILRATGTPIASMKIQLLGAGTNIVLDPILIFGMGMFAGLGIQGAAIATVTGQIIAMIYGIYLVNKSKTDIRFNVKNFHFNKAQMKEILSVAVPTFFMTALSSLMLVLINLILSNYSETTIAAFGVYYKLQSFLLMAIIGLGQGIIPILSYNFGAKNKERLSKTVKYSILYAVIIMGVGTLIMQLFPVFLLSLFDSSSELESIGVLCFRICSTTFVFTGITLILSNVFQSIKKPIVSMNIALARQIFLLIPIAYLLNRLLGLVGVWIAFPIAEIFCATYITFLTLNVFKKSL